MTADPLAALRIRFVARCARDLEELARLVDQSPDQRRDRLHYISHGLCGVAGSFGYQQVSDLAGAIDQTLSLGHPVSPEAISTLMAALSLIAGPRPT